MTEIEESTNDYIDSLKFNGKVGRVTNDRSVWYMDASEDGIALPIEDDEIPDDFKSALSPISELKGGAKCLFKVILADMYWMGVLIQGYDKKPGKRKIFCIVVNELDLE